MLFNRISIVSVLLVLIYLIYIQSLVFQQTKEMKLIKQEKNVLDSLKVKSSSDSLEIITLIEQVNLLENECKRLEQENNIFSSTLAEYESNN